MSLLFLLFEELQHLEPFYVYHTKHSNLSAPTDLSGNNFYTLLMN